jgi:uracil-DNA glycosylase family 4
MTQTSKQQALEHIREQILRDNVCSELAATATQLVFGDGNVDSEVVFIGEAPGKHEDEQGIPFVGAAGKFLNEMLQMVDLKRADIYITNIVKYRPPDNRDPSPAEKKAFLPYLQSQLEVIAPKVIVTLGRHATNCFLPDLQISKAHGAPKRVKLSLKGDSDDTLSVVLLPLFHPAAALYNPAQRQTLIDDFAKIPTIIEKIKANS